METSDLVATFAKYYTRGFTQADITNQIELHNIPVSQWARLYARLGAILKNYYLIHQPHLTREQILFEVRPSVWLEKYL